MLVLISPAKSLDYETPIKISHATQPRLLEDSEKLVGVMKKYSAMKISKLMSVSDDISSVNVDRFQSWERPFNKKNARQALFAFNGDVYLGIDAITLTAKDIAFANQHLRILSGLYGVLRPLDLMQPYRLEMGLSFPINRKSKNLYQFWNERITTLLNEDLAEIKSELVINLASNEYFKSIKPKLLNAEVVTPVFKDFKNGSYKVLSFFAKKARGQMARYILKKKIKNIEKLKAFNVDGYEFNADLSSDKQLVFTRNQEAA